MGDEDPHLVHDLSAYGHLGYDASKGAPSEDGPVQDQYTGTWAVWDPINGDPRLGDFMAEHVIRHMQSQGSPVQKAER